MGGYGSGRGPGKTTTESQQRVDIRYLNQKGWLKPGLLLPLSWTCRGEPSGSITAIVSADRLTLHYRHRENDGEWQTVEEPVPLEWQPCRYGGRRAWFRCPGVVNGKHCNRRVAVLYGAGKYFLCRHCYGLCYQMQREDRKGRHLLKAQNIRQKLGGSGSMANFFPPKPKGMHWRTYQRLEEEAEHAEIRSLFLMTQWMNRAKLKYPELNDDPLFQGFE